MVLKERTHPEDISQRILEVVAECHDIDPDAIEANLEGRVDPESLASLWSEAPRESFGVVSFTLYACRVTVTAAGNVEARLHQ